LSSIQALHLFRIAQEAIHNSLKYADADLLQIRLIATEREVTLSVEDDGSFKQPGEGENGEARFGLDGIYHRAGELGGSASITTRQGTHVHVSIPFNPQKIP